MIEIRLLVSLSIADFRRVASGYISNTKFAVTYTDAPDHTTLDLQPITLAAPYSGNYADTDDATLEHHSIILRDGFSFGAYEGHQLVGLLIAEQYHWNRSLWVHEFHVAETHRRQGIGKRLMERAITAAQTANLRIVVCETQNTNAPAIAAYRALGFRVEGIDLSYYTNADYPDGEVAVFMKRRI